MHVADSLCYTAEANTALYSNYTPIKILKKNLVCMCTCMHVRVCVHVYTHHTYYVIFFYKGQVICLLNICVTPFLCDSVENGRV